MNRSVRNRSQSAKKEYFLTQCLFSALLVMLLNILSSSASSYPASELSSELSSKAIAEQWTNVKTAGGRTAECIQTAPPLSESLQPINLKINHSEKASSITTAEFELQFLNCRISDHKFQWTLAKVVGNDFKQTIKDEMGQILSENISFEKYRVVVTDKDGKTIQSIPLDIKPKLIFKIKINSLDISKDAISNLKYVDVAITADRTRQTSADRFFDEVNWGQYRLQLK